MNIRKAIFLLLCLAAAGYILLFLGIAARRVGYPFELEWQEGGVADHVLRLVQGKPLFVAPSLDFVPFIYPPLYYEAGAVLFRLQGPGLLPLRLISLLCTILTLALLFVFVRKETRSNAAALIAAGIYAASFPLSGGWFDLARVDSLFVLLLFAGFYFLRFREDIIGAAAAGVLFWLAFLTKQSVLLPSLIVGAGLLLVDRRRGLMFLLLSIGLSGLSILWMDHRSDGWFSYYLFLTRTIPLESKMFLEFWTGDVAVKVPFALGLTGWMLYRMRAGQDRARFLCHASFAVAMLALAWGSRIHNGGFLNVLMPLHLLMALQVGLALGEAEGGVLIPALCVAQFVVMIYNPKNLVPTPEDRAAGERMIVRLRSIPGDVLIPYHGLYSTMAGKQIHAHIQTQFEIVAAGDEQNTLTLVEDVRKRLQSREYAAIVLDRPWFQKDIDQSYVKAGNVFDNDRVFWTLTGVRFRPELIYVPKPAQLPASGTPDRMH